MLMSQFDSWATLSRKEASAEGPGCCKLRVALASKQARSLSHWLNAVCYRKKELTLRIPVAVFSYFSICKFKLRHYKFYKQITKIILIG